MPPAASARQLHARSTGTAPPWWLLTFLPPAIVALTGAQGSGILRSMSVANGLVVLRHEQGSVARGERVDVLPFDGLV